jgi:two-component system nitrogen regulation response regulator GlnG
MLPGLVTSTSPLIATVEPQNRQTRLKEFIQHRLATGSEVLHEEAHRELDLMLLPEVMEHTKGNQFQAAKVLGIARQTLRNRLRQLSLASSFPFGSDDAA